MSEEVLFIPPPYIEYIWPPKEVDENDHIYPHICRDGLKQFISEHKGPLFLVIGGDFGDEDRLKKGLAEKGFTCVYMNSSVGQVTGRRDKIKFPDDIPDDLVLADFNNYYHLKALAESFPSTFDHIMFDFCTGYFCEWHDDAFYVEIMKLLKPGGTFTNPCMFVQHSSDPTSAENPTDVENRFISRRNEDNDNRETFDENSIGIDTRHRVELFDAGPRIILDTYPAAPESVIGICRRYWIRHFLRLKSYVSKVEFIPKKNCWFGPSAFCGDDTELDPLYGKNVVMVLTKPSLSTVQTSVKNAKSYRRVHRILKECVASGRERELSRFTPRQYLEYKKDLKKAGSTC